MRPVMTRLPDETASQLERIALAEDRSVSSVVRRLLEQVLAGEAEPTVLPIGGRGTVAPRRPARPDPKAK